MKLFDFQCNINQCVISSSYFPIKVTRAKTVTDGRRFLIGDAAINTHFFTGSGLNLGIEIANTLADLFLKLSLKNLTNQDMVAEFNQSIDKGATLIKNKVLEVRTDFDTIKDKCQELHLDDLKIIAKSINLPYSYVNKNELCQLLKEELTFREG